MLATSVNKTDSQTNHRRPINERRDHENVLLYNYDGSQHTKYGTSPLS
ncbi:hypothetical protein I4U23_024658 [Adineta vaga]|nr:hypothetical protein I4U23_024658 [Adineta vaga]